MKIRSPAFLLAAALVLGACTAALPIASPDRPARTNASIDAAAFEHALADQRRLHSVAFPILSGLTEYCSGGTRQFFGLSTATDATFEGETRRIATTSRGLDRGLTVLYTVPGSPADRVGLRRGDKIISVDGQIVMSGDSGSQLLYSTMDASRGETMVLAVRRDAIQYNAIITPTPVCDIEVELARTSDVFAWTNGKKVKIGEGMMRFAETDPELALVVSHELAHIVLKHTGSFFGRGSIGLEEEADYVGLYILARGGYDPEKGVRLFDRMAAAFPWLDDAPSHPPLRARLKVLRETVREIRQRTARGQALVPESYRAQLLGPDLIARR